MREELEKILADSVHTAITRIGTPEPSNQAYAEAEILFGHGNGSITQMENFLAKQISKVSTDQILTLLDKSLPKRKPETNADCKWPEHPNNIKCYTAHVPPLKFKEIPENISWNACLQEIKDKLK